MTSQDIDGRSALQTNSHGEQAALSSSESLASYIELARQSVRLNSLATGFSRIANGDDQVPLLAPVQPDLALFAGDRATVDFAATYVRLIGNFTRHFIASVPYSAEEECRLGAAIVRFAKARQNATRAPQRVYTIGSGDAAMARAIGFVGSGAIETLSCSPTAENEAQFTDSGVSEFSCFALGPFFDVVQRVAGNRHEASTAFDVIVEDTTFQMYGQQRREPTAIVVRVLKEDGVLVLIEKCNLSDEREYKSREQQKDHDFKLQFFSEEQVAAKNEWVVGVMRKQQVTLERLVIEVAEVLPNVAVVWNSGNFYTIVAARHAQVLSDFVSSLVSPCIPVSFCYENLPRPLAGCNGVELRFRLPEQ